jgi:hypothetical protein
MMVRAHTKIADCHAQRTDITGCGIMTSVGLHRQYMPNYCVAILKLQPDMNQMWEKVIN